MKFSRALILPAALFAGGITVWLLRRDNAPDPVPASGAAVGAGQSKPAAGIERIPEGKGSTTEAGKFVPAGAAEARAVSRDKAEQQLRTALKVEELAPGKFRVGKVIFDARARTASVPAKLNMRDGVIEYVLTTEAGKVHEALLTTPASPRDLHVACLLLGMKGAPLTGGAGEAMAVPAGEGVRISVTWETNGPPRVVPLAALLRTAKGNPAEHGVMLADGPWHYTGSRFSAAGPFAAEVEGSFISLIRDDAALLNYPGPTRDDDEMHLPNAAALPPAGTPVTLVFQLPAQS